MKYDKSKIRRSDEIDRERERAWRDVDARCRTHAAGRARCMKRVRGVLELRDEVRDASNHVDDERDGAQQLQQADLVGIEM